MSTPAPEIQGLTLKEVAEVLGIPLYRVRRVVQLLGERLSSRVTERGGRRGARQLLYDPEAVAAIRRQLAKEQIRKERSSQDAAGWGQRLAQLRLEAHKLGRLSRDLKTLYGELRRNPPLTALAVSTLPDPQLSLAEPIMVLLAPCRPALWQASWPEARIEARATTAGDALRKLRQEIVSTWKALEEAPEQDPERFRVLGATIRRPKESLAAGQAGNRFPRERRSLE